MPSLVSLGLGDQLRAPQEPDEVMRRWLTTTCARFLVWTLSPTLSAVWLASPALVVREHHSPHEFRFTATWSVERTGSAPAACLTRCFTVASPRGKCVASNSALDLANLLCPLVFRLDGQHVSRNSNRAFAARNGALRSTGGRISSPSGAAHSCCRAACRRPRGGRRDCARER